MHREVMVIKYSGEPRSEPNQRMVVNDEEWILHSISVNYHYVEETWVRFVDYINRIKEVWDAMYRRGNDGR